MKSLFTAAAAVALLLGVPSAAQAADAYVDDETGNDTAPCGAIGDPCKTIEQGIDAAGANDTIRVDDSATAYAGPLTLSNGKSLLAQNFVTADYASTIIDGGDGATAVSAITVPGTGSAGTIQGFTLRSQIQNSGVVRLGGPATLMDNTFDEAADGATNVWVESGAGASLIERNTFKSSQTVTQDAIRITGSAPTIRENSFSDFLGALTVSDDGGDPTITDNVITGTHSTMIGSGIAVFISQDAEPTLTANTIVDPGPSVAAFGVVLNEETTTVTDDTGVTMSRNEIYDHDVGLALNDTTGAVTLNGDVIANGGGAGIEATDFSPFASGEADVSATNVTIFGNSTDVAASDNHVALDSSILGTPIFTTAGTTCTITFTRGPTTSGTPCQAFQTNAPPAFVNAAADNYHLAFGSPMIDQGDPVPPGPGSVDLDGDPRALAGVCGGTARRDMGADEFVPDCTPPPDNGGGGTVKKCAGRTVTGTNGTPGNDVLVGNGKRNRIRGRGGNDLICGLGARDRLIGGKGKDRLIGGKGPDVLRGGVGRDVLIGGPGGDLLLGGGGRDKLRGGPGRDSQRQ